MQRFHEMDSIHTTVEVICQLCTSNLIKQGVVTEKRNINHRPLTLLGIEPKHDYINLLILLYS